MNRPRTPRIGLDFGGVIVESKRSSVGEDTVLASTDGIQIARPGVFNAVEELVSLCEGRIWIVSQAGLRTQAGTRKWLETTDFFGRTGLEPEHVRFCLEREGKLGICRELAITHFVDDRIHVMQILRHDVPHLYLFGQAGDEKYCPPWATFVSSWAQIVGRIKAS